MKTTDTLVPSPALKGVLATLSALQRLDPSNASAYAPVSQIIAASQVREWERELGITLPSDAVVLAALNIPLIDRALGTIGDPHASHDALDEHPDGEEWCLVWSGDPWALTQGSQDSTYQQMLDLSIAVRRENAMPADPRVLVLITDEDAREMRLSAYLLERLEEYFIPTVDEERDAKELERLEQLWQEARANPASDEDIERDYAASLEPDAKAAPTERIRVRHKKFGPGTIVGTTEQSVEVLFDSGETKRLKREYLQAGDD